LCINLKYNNSESKREKKDKIYMQWWTQACKNGGAKLKKKIKKRIEGAKLKKN
jgi:hypothetical protein